MVLWNTSFTRFGVCLLIFVGVPSVACDERSYADQVQQLLSWIPDETESLIVFKGPSREAGDEKGSIPILPGGSVIALSSIRGGRFQKALMKYPIVLAAHTSCRFQNPVVDRAQVQFAGCQLVVFDQDITSAAENLLKDMAAVTDGSVSIGGRHILRFKEKVNRVNWAFLVCSPTPNVLVVATDEQYLRRLIERIDHPVSASFLHDRRLEAELTHHADAPLWAVRRFKRPLLDTEIPPNAIGYYFRLVDEQKTASIIFLGGQETTVKSVHDLWKLFPPVGTDPEVTELGDGVFEVRHSIAEEENWGGFLMLLVWRLGHLFG